MSAAARRLRMLVLWIGLGMLFGTLFAAVAPQLLGFRSFTVRSGSMTPAIETGDVVVTQPISPLSARVGDVVTFVDPEGTGKLFSHRVQSVRAVGDEVAFVTRGDANTSTEHWRVPANGNIGRVAYRIPKIGYALSWIDSGPARLALIAIPALLLLWAALVRIWRPEPEIGSL
ncbi:MAG TPA: signal peptidase I [Solirubrobacterales bacterium]|nr:signal peptidase I [Solirubrobacterales bacterium]